MADLVHLLTHPAARAALAQRDIAAVYGILRDAGVSQARIADGAGGAPWLDGPRVRP